MSGTRKPLTPAEPVKKGFFQKFNAYVAKNQAVNKKLGEPSLTDEISKLGSDWGKNLSRGMAEVGNTEEAKIMGKTKKQTTPGTFNDEDDYSQDILFGSKKQKPVPQGTRVIQNEPIIDDGKLQLTFLESGILIIKRSGAGIALDQAEQKRVYTLLKKLVG